MRVFLLMGVQKSCDTVLHHSLVSKYGAQRIKWTGATWTGNWLSAREQLAAVLRTGTNLAVMLPGIGDTTLDLHDIVMTETLVWRPDFQNL